MFRREWVMLIILATMLALMGFGCSGPDPAIPPTNDIRDLTPAKDAASGASSRPLLGMWSMVYDPVAHTITPTPMRATSQHLNVLEILEHPGALIDLNIKNLDDTAMPVVNVDVGLHHPFTGLTEFTGFDVHGIVIFRGNQGGWADASIKIPTRNEPRLTNADGWTRWWNPSEFNGGTLWFEYMDGLLGAPHSWANFTSVLNGYKLFTADLLENDTLDALVPANRAIFHDGAWNWRHYTIDFGKVSSNWIIFNYAVDANWEFPATGTPPYTIDDFAANANAAEAYRVKVTETANTLTFDGYSGSGNLSLDIDVYDWQNPGQLTTVTVEALELGPAGALNAASVVPGSGGINYSTYHVDIVGLAPTHAGKADILITVPCPEGSYQPGLTSWAGTSPYAAYQVYPVTIGGSNCPPYAKVNNNGWQADENVAPNSVPNRKCIWSDGVNVYVVWIDSRATDPDVYFNKSGDGGVSWMPLDKRLTDDIVTNRIQRYPQMAVTLDGSRICVLWDDQRYSPIGPNQDIDEPMYTISNDFGATWSVNYSAKLGGIPNLNQYQPAVASDVAGNFYMTWIDEDIGVSGDKVCMFAKVPVGSDIVSANVVVGDKVGTNYFGAQDWKIDIEYDENNDTIYVVWPDTRNKFSGTNTSVDIFIDKSTDGGTTWGTDHKVNPDTTNTQQYHPTIEVGDSGVIYVAYIDEQSGTTALAFVKSFSGGASFTGYKLIDSLVGAHWYPDMDRGGLENMFVVWQMDNTSYLSWSCDEGDTWQPPQMIDPVETPDQVTSPGVSVGANQKVFVTARFRADTGQPSHTRVWRWE